MQKLAAHQPINSITIYSPMFNDLSIPRHIRLDRHTTALFIQEWLADSIDDGTAVEVEPKQPIPNPAS